MFDNINVEKIMMKYLKYLLSFIVLAGFMPFVMAQTEQGEVNPPNKAIEEVQVQYERYFDPDEPGEGLYEELNEQRKERPVHISDYVYDDKTGEWIDRNAPEPDPVRQAPVERMKDPWELAPGLYPQDEVREPKPRHVPNYVYDEKTGEMVDMNAPEPDPIPDIEPERQFDPDEPGEGLYEEWKER